MDWIEEKADRLKTWVRNLSFRKAMLAYIAAAAIATAVLSFATMTVCYRFESIIWNEYADKTQKESLNDVPLWPDWSIAAGWHVWADSFDGFRDHDRRLMQLLDTLRVWCPFIYGFAGTVAAVFLFYRNRLKHPFVILSEGAEAIRQNNLDIHIHYDSEDEMGQLCRSFDGMREVLVHNKEELWQMIESQKKLNAAFAHDLRTPLTVLKGYSGFLARYIPEGKVSEQKMIDTLELMTSHLDRLEQFSRTMKGIRSMEERPVNIEETSVSKICAEIDEIIFALNQIKDIEISFKHGEGVQAVRKIYADKNIVAEVFENLLSNAIRYASHKISVSTKYTGAGGELLLTVADDGPGFSEEDLEKALLPYYREHGKNEEHFGIGLHICSLLCEKHGGTLSIANSISGGAVVTASFNCLYNVYRES